MMLDVLKGHDSGLPILTTLNRNQREELILKVLAKNRFTIGQIRENLPQIKRLVLAHKLQTKGQGKASVYCVV